MAPYPSLRDTSECSVSISKVHLASTSRLAIARANSFATWCTKRLSCHIDHLRSQRQPSSSQSTLTRLRAASKLLSTSKCAQWQAHAASKITSQARLATLPQLPNRRSTHASSTRCLRDQKSVNSVCRRKTTPKLPSLRLVTPPKRRQLWRILLPGKTVAICNIQLWTRHGRDRRHTTHRYQNHVIFSPSSKTWLPHSSESTDMLSLRQVRVSKLTRTLAK